MTLGIASLIVLLLGFGAIPSHAAPPVLAAPRPVLEYHHDAGRSGLFLTPELTFEKARQLRRDPHFQAELPGPIYAQPLYWRRADHDQALLVVATEQNQVYALDSNTGAVVWKTALGPPVPLSALPCGNIDPLGITGTPVIDPRSGTLYLAALVGGASPTHQVFALSLHDGAVLPGWPLDVEKALEAHGHTFHSLTQNQRGALTLIGNTLYVPYGGHYGDCGDYHGWVVGVSLHPPALAQSWSTRARGGGVWAPGGLSSDGQALYVATGNSLNAHTWSDGEAVIRLGLDLSFSRQARDFFAPPDWQRLDSQDADLGGTNPLPLSLPHAPLSELLLALGKDGKAYLLNRPNLGGLGGSLVAQQVARGPIRTAPAAVPLADGLGVAFQGSGAACPAGQTGDLTLLKIRAGSPPALSTVWCGEVHGRGSPIITTTDGTSNAMVWAVGAEGDNRLHGFRADTGEVVFAGGGAAEAMGLVRRFQTVIAAGGRLYVAADRQVYAFVY